MWAFSSPSRASSSARYRPSSFWWAVVGTVSDVSLEVVSKETYFKKRSVTCMVVPPVSGIPQDAGILCLVLYHSFGKIRDFFRRRGRFFCGGGDFRLSNGGGCAILTTVCGRGGIGRLDGFRSIAIRRAGSSPAAAPKTGRPPHGACRFFMLGSGVRAVPLINGSCDANALIRLPFSGSTQLCSSRSGQLPAVRIG